MRNPGIPLKRTLGDVCEGDIQTGPFGSQLHAHEYIDDPTGVAVIMPKDINNGKVSYKTPSRISLSRAAKLNKHILRQGDIIFSRRGDVTRLAVIFDKSPNAICGTGCLRARPSKSVNPEYLAFYLNQSAVANYLVTNAVGQTMLNLNSQIVGDLPVTLPPLPEQKKIAQILSTWDKAIELLEKKIAAKEKLKKGLMQQLLTGTLRLRSSTSLTAGSATGEPFGPPAKKGELPEGWREVKLGDVFTERAETGFNDLPLLAITADRGVIYRDELEKKDNSNEDKSKYRRICPGDIGYNTMRMWQGRSGVSELEGIVSPAYTIVTPAKDIDVYFAGYLFKLPMIVHRFWRYSQGLVDDTLNCKFNSFSKVIVYLPGIKEQRKIAQVIKNNDENIKVLNSKLITIQNQKKGLMQQLLTGKVRVTSTPLSDRDAGSPE